MKKIRVGLLCGNDISTKLEPTQNNPVNVEGNNDAWKLIDQKSDIEYARLHITKNYLKQGRRWDLDSFDVLFNAISDYDQNPGTLSVIEKIAKGTSTPILNAPQKIKMTTRDAVSNALGKAEDIYTPTTRRVPNATADRLLRAIDDMDADYPFIIRSAGTHTGNIMNLVSCADDVAKLTISKRDTCYVTEFVDFRDRNGYFRKFRVFCIGGNIIPRHALSGETWNIHAAVRGEVMRSNPSLIEFEKKFLETWTCIPNLHSSIQKIRRKLRCEYLGIDFSLKADNTMLIFEANPVMNFFPFSDDIAFSYSKSIIPNAIQAMTHLIGDALSMPRGTERAI